jgi:membrane-associated protease RseP (regulator of RpoE activity)
MHTQAAADAGLRKGDIVLSVDGDAVKNRDAFTRVFKALVAGDRVKLRLERRSSTMNIDLVIGANGVSMREITRLSKVASGGDDDGKSGTVGDRDRERSRERGGLDEIPARGRAIGRDKSPPGRGRNIGRDDSLTDRDQSRSRVRDAPLTGGRGYAPEISSTGNVSSGNW